MDTGSFGGSAGSMIQSFTYDVGSDTATKTMSVEGIFGTMAMNISAQKSGSVMKANIVIGSSAFAVATDTSSNISMVDYQMGVDPGATAPTSGSCFTRSRSGTDWTYTTASNSVCSALTFAAYPASEATVSAYTVSSIAAGWNGMAATPSSL